VTVLVVIASALGGGIVASLLEAWFRSIREYEAARLLVLSDLIAMRAISDGLGTLAEPLSATDIARLRFPTSAWTQGRSRLATRLLRHDSRLFGRLSGFFAVIEGSPPSGPLIDESHTELLNLRAELTQATLGVFAETVVYGPRYAWGRHRRRRHRRETGAQKS